MSARFVFALLGLFLTLCPPASGAQERQPLLQDGKKTLYQRVVTHPGAVLLSAPAPDAAVIQDRVKTFSVFYVFAGEKGYLEVGPSSSAARGWIRESDATFWPQAITMLFTERSNRNPALFFRDSKSLEDLCAAGDMRGLLQSMEKQMAADLSGKPAPADFPIIAAEPADAEGAVSADRFYLMPVKNMVDPFVGTKFLEVASIDPAQGAISPAQEEEKAAPTARPRVGVAFVIDSTISMRFYIEASLNVIRSAFDNIAKQSLGEDVGFAVVAFRNNIAERPGLEYLTKKICDFTALGDRKKLENALSRVREANVSSHAYDEDSMSGLKAAIDDLDWEGYNARVIVLITDAGPLRPGDPLAQTPLLPNEMRDYARAKNIWLTVCHILSPRGEADHEYAAAAYKDLARISDQASSYMPINAPDGASGAENFRRTAEQLAAGLIKVIRDAGSGEIAVRPVERPVEGQDEGVISVETQARRLGESIGYAAYLDFLGKMRGNRSPQVVNAWIADMDLIRLAEGQYAPVLEAAVLVTKNQLSDLQRTLQIIVNNAERTKKTDARDFFQSILAASAQTARDPAALSPGLGGNLMETGVLGELLEGLPYKSDIMLLREDDWYRMSIGEQTFFINRLKSRISRYEEYDRDVSAWESFGAPNSGDWVCRVPLGQLP
ncbi:MAG: VWA domain-containing protein [Desulfovibrio sp.]|jgi:serine/threonine-protein kinase PpkA|nr:VWA domain-containing protein [Desulfovibrio sp.]